MGDVPVPLGYISGFLNRGDIRAIGHRRAQVVREAAVDLAQEEVRHDNPNKRSRPDYHSSFYSTGPRVTGPTELTWEIGNKAPHAKFVEHGTLPHTIRARTGPMLTFFWEREQSTFVGPMVSHPGAYRGRGKKILERALRLSGGGALRFR